MIYFLQMFTQNLEEVSVFSTNTVVILFLVVVALIGAYQWHSHQIPQLRGHHDDIAEVLAPFLGYTYEGRFRSEKISITIEWIEDGYLVTCHDKDGTVSLPTSVVGDEFLLMFRTQERRYQLRPDDSGTSIHARVESAPLWPFPSDKGCRVCDMRFVRKV